MSQHFRNSGCINKFALYRLLQQKTKQNQKTPEYSAHVAHVAGSVYYDA